MKEDKRRSICSDVLLAVAGWLFGITPVSAMDFTEVESAAARIDALDLRERDAPIREHLAPLIERAWRSGDAPEVEDQTLRRWFGLAEKTVESVPALAGSMTEAFNELDRRGLATPADTRAAVFANLAARRFQVAQDIATVHGPIDHVAVPRYIDSPVAPSARTILGVSDDGSTVERVVSAFGGSGLILVMHPYCGPSRRALETFATDARLLALSPDRLAVVAPVAGSMGWSGIAAWNREHPAFRIVIAYRAEEWPEIATMGTTPQFIAASDGKVIDHFAGWPSEGAAARFDALMDRLAGVAY